MIENGNTAGADDKSNFKKEKIVRLINSVIKKVEFSNSGDMSRDAIYEELKTLKQIIDESRREIGMARPSDINDKDIPDATDELDAVIEATAHASGTIMDCCEAIQEKANAIGGSQAEAINAEVTKIFEACSFQDITGQRIRKVVKTLQSIEERVSKLVTVLGDKDSEDKAPAVTGDAALLNGPQLAGQGISQADIDKLLEEFD